MATTTKETKKVYSAEEKEQGRKLFADLRNWGTKDGKPASTNMKLAGVISLLNDCKENLLKFRNYDELSKVDNVITAVKNYKVYDSERITALFEAKNNETTS